MVWSCARALVAVVLAATAFAAPAVAAAAGDESVTLEVRVRGGRLVLGGTVSGQALVGRIIPLSDGAGKPFSLRIDAVTAGPTPDIELYAAQLQRDGGTGWQPLCQDDPDGLSRLIAIAQDAAADSATFNLTCTSGARGKCVLRGYRPWASANGVALAPYFAACVHMLRADYCGNGESATKAGIAIDVWDRLGTPRKVKALPFEAAWGPDGAVCLARPRIASMRWDALLAACPALRSRLRPDCSDDPGQPGGTALLWNASGL